MKAPWIFTLVLASLATCAAEPQQRQTIPRCLLVDDMDKRLRTEFKEQPAAYAVQSNGHLLMVYTGETNYTIVSINPKTGRSCIQSTGRYWTVVPRGVLALEW